MSVVEKKRIQVVDDDAVFLKLVERDLTNAGYSVIISKGSREAVTDAKAKKPHLILLDINMPGMDGGEVSGILKSHPDTQDIPILFLTSLVTKQEETKGKKIGGNHILAKPYNPPQLLDSIRKWIKQ